MGVEFFFLKQRKSSDGHDQIRETMTRTDS